MNAVNPSYNQIKTGDLFTRVIRKLQTKILLGFPEVSAEDSSMASPIASQEAALDAGETAKTATRR